MIREILASVAIGAVTLSAPMIMAQETHQTSGNVNWLIGEFDRRMNSEADLVARIGRIHAEKEFPGILLNDMMNREQMTFEDHDQFVSAIQPVFQAAHAKGEAELKAIIADLGWDGLNALGPYVMSQVFDIVLHAPDVQFQAAAIPTLEPLARDDFINPYIFALFYDDVMVQTGQPQRWGTQSECVNGEWKPFPIDEPETVDARREAVGMSPLDEFLDGEIELYGNCVGDG